MNDVTEREVETTSVPPRSTKQMLVASGMGNALEWYDWGIYSSFAIYFAPSSDATLSPGLNTSVAK